MLRVNCGAIPKDLVESTLFGPSAQVSLLRVLEVGAFNRGRDAQRRPCRLRAEALREVTQWTEHTRRAWEERFDRLGDYLRELQAREPITDTPKEEEEDHGDEQS